MRARGPESPRSGASQSRTRWRDRWTGYWAHHRSSAVDAWRRLLATPAQSLMTGLVVAIALALPAVMLLALDNIGRLGQQWDTDPKLSVYLEQRLPEAARVRVAEALAEESALGSVVYISPQQALANFESQTGWFGVLQGLDGNPLPGSFVASLTLDDPLQLEALSTRLGALSGVDEVVMDLAWVQRLNAMMALGEQLVTLLALLLSLGVLLAIGNTIRLAIENRRDEIIVAKLVGGTDGFVRRPFLYSGAWVGGVGGVLACMITAVGFAALRAPVGRLSGLYDGEYQLEGLGLALALQLVTLGLVLGWFGAFLTVGRHIRLIEPT